MTIKMMLIVNDYNDDSNVVFMLKAIYHCYKDKQLRMKIELIVN